MINPARKTSRWRGTTNFWRTGGPVLLCTRGQAYSVLDAGILLQSLDARKKIRADTARRGAGTWRSPLDAEFEIPKAYKLICGLALGYASDAPINQFQPDDAHWLNSFVAGKVINLNNENPGKPGFSGFAQ